MIYGREGSCDPKSDTIGIPLWLSNKHVTVDVYIFPCGLVEFEINFCADGSNHNIELRPGETGYR